MTAPAGNVWRMTLTNSNEGGILNLAQFGIETHSGLSVSVAQQCAQILAYVVGARANWLASGTLITRMQYRAAGSGGFLDVPFPDTEYNDMVPLNGALVAMHAYADTVLGISGGLAPVGTSVCVTEYSAGFGRRSRGRHFLPFVGKTKVDGNGNFDDTSATNIERAYGIYILGDDGVTYGTEYLDPVILSATLSTQTPVTHVVAQPILSNLRSRRR